eukprot:scaffold114534_cov57-Phaeocystis_antarctica.AAC.1
MPNQSMLQGGARVEQRVVPRWCRHRKKLQPKRAYAGLSLQVRGLTRACCRVVGASPPLSLDGESIRIGYGFMPMIVDVVGGVHSSFYSNPRIACLGTGGGGAK